MRVTIHLLTKDRPSELAMCLNSLYTQTFKNWDLILVDSGSTPVITYKFINDIIQRIRLSGHWVKYINKMGWCDIGKLRNIAIEEDIFNRTCLRIDDDSIADSEYLDRLVQCYIHYSGYKEGQVAEKLVAVGGVVPPCGSPKIYMPIPESGIFNEIKFDLDGNITYIADDGGYTYDPFLQGMCSVALPSHHLRSSFIFPNPTFDKRVPLYPEEYGQTGYREETDWCIAFAYAGGKMYTVTDAICWHAHGRSGGARIPNYQEIAQINDIHFREKIKRWYQERGNPFENKK